MPTFSISQKLIFGFATLVVLVAATGGVGFVTGDRLYRQLDEVTGVTLPSVDLLLQIDRDLHQVVMAERSTIFTESATEAFEKLQADHTLNLRQAAERWEELKRIGLPQGGEAFASAYDKRISAWTATTTQVMNLCAEHPVGQRQDAIILLSGVGMQQFDHARECLDALTELFEQHAHAQRADGLALRQRSLAAGIGVTAISVGVGLLLVWTVGIRLGRTLRAVAQSLSANAQQNAASAEHISTSAQALATGATEQAASIEETSAALEEMTGMSNRIAEHAAAARVLSLQTRETADRGGSEMQQMGKAVAAIERSSANIADIIRTIDEIAFQTNILALNAAVEAARAGSAGAGFSIVADEVRSLAHRSAQAARETAEKIEESVRASREGADFSRRVSACLDEMKTGALEVDRLVEQIAVASQRQAEGAGQLNGAVSQIDQVTQSNAAVAEESASAAEELSAQTVALDQAIGQLNTLIGGVMVTAQKSDEPRLISTERRRPASDKRPALAGVS